MSWFGRGKEREDAAWSEGYAVADQEWEDWVLRKDAFIAEQSETILELMDVVSRANGWPLVSEKLYSRLRSYM